MECAEMVVRVLLAVQALLAAGIDIRVRRLPNALAATFATTAACGALCSGGPSALARNAACAVLACAALIAFELLWRRGHGGAAGIGMGDVKFLFGAMLLGPLWALLSFALGMVALAIAGLIGRVRAFPALPFIVGAMAVLAIWQW